MNHCPCCHGQLLRQINKGRIYWFCRYCRQAMPIAMKLPSQ